MTAVLEYDSNLTYKGEGIDYRGKGHRAIHREPIRNPGKWKGGTKHDGTRTALISCPTCGGVSSLSGHKIDGNGRVYPSVVCPFRGCKFHDHVVLNGWEPGLLEKGEKDGT